MVNPHRDMIVVHEIERLRVSHLHLYQKRTYRNILVLQFRLYVCNIGVTHLPRRSEERRGRCVRSTCKCLCGVCFSKLGSSLYSQVLTVDFPFINTSERGHRILVIFLPSEGVIVYFC